MIGAFRINTLAQVAAASGPVTYTFRTPSPSAVNEDGSTPVNFIFDTNAASGITVYGAFQINGGALEWTAPTLEWDGFVEATPLSGSGNFQFYAMPDLTTEGTETVVCKLFSDAGRTQLLATSASVTINDTSRTPPTMSFLASSTSFVTTIQTPATSAIGDLAILFDSSTNTLQAVPSGWTLLESVSTTGIRTTISYRILTAAGQQSISGATATSRKLIAVFRPSLPINAVTPTMNVGSATTLTPASQSLVLLNQAKPHIAFAVYASTGAITTRGWTQTGGTPTEIQSVSGSGIYVKYQINNIGSNPQNATITMTDGGSNTRQAGKIQIS